MMSRSLTILFLTNNYTPYSGGVVSSINALTHQLQLQGHQVHIVTLAFVPEHNDPPYVHRLTCPLKFSYKTKHMAIPLFAERQIKKLIEQCKPDIIHSHHPFLLGSAGLAVAKEYGIPMIFTYHSRYEHYLHYLPLNLELISKPMLQSIVTTYCQEVNAIVAPTETMARDLKKDRFTTPIQVIPSIVDARFFQHKQIVRRHPMQIMTVSRFAQEKNIPFLLDMFSGLPQSDFHFTLIGYGPEKETLEHYAFDTLKLTNVTFIEKPSKDDLARYYKNADVFIFASQSETQGLVLAESMASSTPVIALHGPGQDDIVQNGYNGFLVDSMNQMRERLQELKANFDLLNQLSNGAYETAQGYRDEVIGKKIEHLYYTMLDKTILVIKCLFHSRFSR